MPSSSGKSSMPDDMNGASENGVHDHDAADAVRPAIFSTMLGKHPGSVPEGSVRYHDEPTAYEQLTLLAFRCSTWATNRGPERADKHLDCSAYSTNHTPRTQWRRRSRLLGIRCPISKRLQPAAKAELVAFHTSSSSRGSRGAADAGENPACAGLDTVVVVVVVVVGGRLKVKLKLSLIKAPGPLIVPTSSRFNSSPRRIVACWPRIFRHGYADEVRCVHCQLQRVGHPHRHPHRPTPI